jgi:guanine deaminase
MDSGRNMFCGNRSDVRGRLGAAVVAAHLPGFLPPGFVDPHVHFPQTCAGDAYGRRQLLE